MSSRRKSFRAHKFERFFAKFLNNSNFKQKCTNLSEWEKLKMTTIFKSFKKTKTCSIDFEASNLLFRTQNLVHRRTNRLFSIHNLLNFVKEKRNTAFDHISNRHHQTQKHLFFETSQIYSAIYGHSKLITNLG